MEFLDVYRDEEYIRQQAKGMDPETARKFALEYMGWDDEQDVPSLIETIKYVYDPNAELPFSIQQTLSH